MPLRTKLFSLFPWLGGLNTTLDESTIPSNALTVANNCVFGTRGSRKKRDGINHDWDDGTSTSNSVIGMHDFFYGNTSRSHNILAVHSNKGVHSYSTSGTKSADLFAGTAWGSTVSTSSFETLNNLCIIAVDGASNVMKKWDGSGNIEDLGGTPPEASICRVHLGRLWTNDKTNLDRIHYSTTANPEEWNGAGDSGALDIGIGDGDPGGITAIFPSFKGVLFVAKRTKLYKISSYTPETFLVELVSNGVGCVSHNAIGAIDQDDLIFLSERGVHSLSATANYGDFEGAYLSVDIQKEFNENFVRSRLRYSWAAYDPELNSIAFTFSESGSTYNNALWLYNIPQKAWYRWPDLPCQSLILVTDTDRRRFYLGRNDGRISKTKNSTNYDVNTSGTNTSITMRVSTGYIFVDDNPYTIKGFKKLVLYHKPVGTATITVSVKIDNFATQALSFQSNSGADLLGTTFILGSSILGASVTAGPYTQPVDGYGRSVKVTIEQAGSDQTVEIQGFGIEYETSGTQQEVREGDAA